MEVAGYWDESTPGRLFVYIAEGAPVTRLEDHDANRGVACSNCGARDWRIVRVLGRYDGVCGQCGRVSRLNKR